VNDIDDVWLRFKPLARLLRWFSIDAKGIAMKVSLDPDARQKNQLTLQQIATKYNIPLRIVGTTLLRSARQEVALEKAAKHI
jgi:hypothetical protein